LTEADDAASGVLVIIKEYLNELPSWKHGKRPHVDGELAKVIWAELTQKNPETCPPSLQPTANMMAHLIQLGLPGLSWTEKKTVTMISTILTYIDDVAPKNPAPYMDFQRRYTLGLPQLDPVLDCFAEAFTSVYELWDIPFANFMITSALDFITATCVETSISPFTSANRPGRFPWFLRSRDGAAIAYCSMIFPKSGNHDFSAFFRAAPDMEYFSAVTNDLLSFYKEYLANDTDNYIHHRAHDEGKSPLQVLSDIKREMVIASENVIDVLTRFGSEASLKAWEEWEFGFVLMHLELERYKLAGLNLAFQ